MANANPVLYSDTDFAIEACSAPVYSSQTAGANNHDQFTQEFMSLRSVAVPTPFNTPHPTIGGFLLTNESAKTDMGGDVVKWTRTYTVIPTSHDEWESYSYSFIGYVTVLSNVPGLTVQGRPRKPKIVTSKITHEYFLTGKNSSFKTPGEIPVSVRYQYVDSGGVDIDYLSDVRGPFPATSPSLTSYRALVTSASDAAQGWKVKGGWQLQAEDSRLTRWRGNIFLRQIRYVLAQ